MRIPNLVELGRRPDVVRYVWVLVKEGKDVHMGAGWISLFKILTVDVPRPLERYERFAVVDLKRNIVFDLEPMKWLEMWRPHYFDPDWDLPIEKNV